MQKLFVYGTLRQPEIQWSVIGRQATSSPDRLCGFIKSKVVINGKSYPIAVPSKRGCIEGSVLEVDNNKLPALDEYETDAYTRVRVFLQSGEEA